MKRWLVRIGYGALAVGLPLAIFILFEQSSGSSKLHRYLDSLKARGEELSATKLAPRLPPPEENAAIDFNSLTNVLAGVKYFDGPPTLRFVTPGRAVVAWRLKEWSDDGGKTTNDWETLDSDLASAQPILDRVNRALAKPSFVSPIDYSKGFDTLYFGPLISAKRGAQFLDGAVMQELYRGKTDAANLHLCALVKLTAMQRDPFLICQLVRIACGSIAFDATWQALQAPGWSDSQLAALQAAWSNWSYLKDMPGAMAMERDCVLIFFDQAKSSSSRLSDLSEGLNRQADDLNDKLPYLGTIYKGVYPHVWRMAWADEDEWRSLQRAQDMLDMTRIATTNYLAAAATLPGRMYYSSKYDQLRYAYLSYILTSETTEYCVRRAASAEAEQQMALAAIAIKRFQLRTGQFPTNLSALVPDLLPTLPRDSMDGKPLRYKLNTDGTFVLYSVGTNGIDDGGNPVWATSGKISFSIWDGIDAVWPNPATDEEAAITVTKRRK